MWLTLVPALVALAALAFFLAIPRLVKGKLAARGPTKLRVFMETSVESIEDTRRLMFTPDWRLIGAYAFLWCDIAVLVVCFAAAGVSPPVTTIVLAYQIAYMTNVIPVPGNIGVLDGSMVALFALYGVGPRWRRRRPSFTTRSRCGSRRCGGRRRTSCCG